MLGICTPKLEAMRCGQDLISCRWTMRPTGFVVCDNNAAEEDDEKYDDGNDSNDKVDRQCA